VPTFCRVIGILRCAQDDNQAAVSMTRRRANCGKNEWRFIVAGESLEKRGLRASHAFVEDGIEPVDYV